MSYTINENDNDQPLIDPDQAVEKKFGQNQPQSSDSEHEDNISMAKASDSIFKKTKRTVQRSVPVVADLIIILAYLFLFFIFMYYAYIFKPTSNLHCYANAQSVNKALIPGTATIGVDVTAKFKLAITFGFWISAINILRVVLAQGAIYFNNVSMQYLSYLLHAINSVLFITLFVFMNIWRFDNAGIVCSGGKMSATDRAAKVEPYLWQQGLFLKWFIIVTYLFLMFGFIGGCCVALFFTKKHQAIGLFKEGGLFYEKVKPSWQINVEVNDGLANDKVQLSAVKEDKKKEKNQ